MLHIAVLNFGVFVSLLANTLNIYHLSFEILSVIILLIPFHNFNEEFAFRHIKIKLNQFAPRLQFKNKFISSAEFFVIKFQLFYSIVPVD